MFGRFSRGASRQPADLREQAEDEDRRQNYAKSTPIWRCLASEGDPRACLVLGQRYESGLGVVQNFAEAAGWFRKAAEGGLVEAQAKLGEIYFFGRAVPASAGETGPVEGSALGRFFPGGGAVAADYKLAAHWNLMAADGGDAGAQVRWAYQCASGLGLRPDLAEAEHWFAEAARDGHAGGAFGLGMIHASGPEPEKAVQWFEKAARTGHSGAQLALGLLHLQGHGAPRDAEKAASLIASAAAADELEAMYYWGQCLRAGVGVEPDELEAEVWLKRAASKGHVKAKVSVAGLLLESPTGDAAAAATYLREAAEGGDAEAQNALGRLYLDGRGVPQDAIEAALWLRSAADQGDPAACERLGALHADGIGFEANAQIAAKWFLKAAKLGSAAALHNLGALADATGEAIEGRDARSWYLQAAGAGSPQAVLKLGVIRAQAAAGPEDFAAAAQWFAKGFELGDLDCACNLALLHLSGLFAGAHPAVAVEVLGQAAERGSRPAAWKLHALYSGEGPLPADFAQARRWLIVAAEGGDGAAACRLADEAGVAGSSDLEPARLVHLLTRAAERGDVGAQERLGRMHADGRSPFANSAKALRWNSRAAENGSPAAQTWLADALKEGRDLVQDHEVAAAWYLCAAEQGHAPAMAGLTELALEQGLRPETQASVLALWRAPAQAGEVVAQRMLGRLLLRGVGGPASPIDGVRWLQAAAAQGDEVAQRLLSTGT